MINDTLRNAMQKVRRQTNFDVRAFGVSDSEFAQIIGPSRSPEKVERYQTTELLFAEPTQPTQVIDYERSLVYNTRAAIGELRSQIASARASYQRVIRAEWDRLVRTTRVEKVFWTKRVVKRFKPAKWVKIPTGRSRTLRRRVYLKSRLVRVVQRVPKWDPSTGRTWIERIQTVRMVRPYVWRTLTVPVFRKQVVRPAGVYAAVTRIRETRNVPDWGRIRPLYTLFKGEQRDGLALILAPKIDRLNRLIDYLRVLCDEPHRMRTYTDHAFIPPTWRQYYALQGKLDEDPVYAYKTRTVPYLDTIWSLWSSAGLSAVFAQCTSLWATSHSSSLAGILAFKRSCEVGTLRDPQSGDHACTAPWLAAPPTYFSTLKSLDSSRDLEDEKMEGLAFSEVAALRKSRDYSFNVIRSIAELKDLSQTGEQGFRFWDFVKSLGSDPGPVAAAAPKLGVLRAIKTKITPLKFLAAVYLAVKFGIEPTVQDIDTVLSHSSEWLTSTRRALSDAISSCTRARTNILHLRRRFRAADFRQPRDTVDVGGCAPVTVEVTDIHSYSQPGIACVNRWSAGWDIGHVEVQPFEGCAEMAPMRATVDISGGGFATATVESPELTKDVTTSAATRLTFSSAAGSYTLGTDGGLHPSAYLDPYKDQAGIDQNVRLAEDMRLHPTKIGNSGYVANAVSGVVFARYAITDVMDFIGYRSGLEELDRHVTRLERFRDIVSDLSVSGAKFSDFCHNMDFRKAYDIVQAVRLIWELYPLSFVYDWFTDSAQIVARIDNLVTIYFGNPPPSLDGVWVTKRVELLAGQPELRILSSKVSRYVTDWYGARCVGYQYGALTESYYLTPKREIISSVLSYQPDCEVRLERTGLYAAKRGEYIAGGWETFLPSIQVKLNAGKVGTLLALAANFLRGKR